MNADLGKTTFSPDEIDELRSRLAAYKEEKGLSWPMIGQQTGVAQGTISQWVPGNYNGGGAKLYENQEIPGKVMRFFLSLEARARLEATLPQEPTFQHTDTAKAVHYTLEMAQAGDMIAVSTPPGLGKTAACRQYAATRPQVWMVTCSPSSGGVATFLIELLRAFGVREAKGSPQMLSRQVRDRVRESGGLIICDEAQYLQKLALEELRAIHDDTGIGVALVGDENLAVNLRRYAQLFSRLGMKFTQRQARSADIELLAAAWGVTGARELAFLKEIGRKSGALRAVTKTLKLAVRAARQREKTLSVADLHDAYGQLHAQAEAA